MKVVIYARQSSGDSDESLSVDSQIEKCREVCEKNGWEIVGIFSDLNTSGRTYPVGAEEIAKNDSAYQEWFRSQSKGTMFRAGLGKALDTEKDAIVLYDETRLMRPWADTFLESYIRQRLKGIKVFTVKEGEIRLDQFTGRLVNSITNQVEDNQLQVNKRKSIEALDRLKRDGIKASGKAPYGYDYDRNTKTLVPNRHLEEVRMAFRMFLEGQSSSAICRAINASSDGGRKWNILLLHKTLSLPCYCGLMRYNGILRRMKDGQVAESAVSEEDWHRVKARLDAQSQPKGQRKYAYALTGLVFCGYCRSPLRIISSTTFEGPGKPRGERIHSYYCFTGYMSETTKGDCSLVRTRYSLQEPLAITYRDDFEASYDGLAGRFNRSMVCGITYPALEIKGLYEGLMPFLFPIAIKGLDNRPSVSQTDLTAIDNDIQTLRKKQEDLERMAIEGLLPYEKIASHLRENKAKISESERKRQSILDELANHDKNAVQRNANRLMRIRKGTLHPQDWRELFLREYECIIAYASKIVLKRKDGGEIAIQKICDRATIGLPPSILEHDGKTTTITMLYKSAWKEVIYDEDGEPFYKGLSEVVFSSDGLVVRIAGENPLPGDGSSPKRISERTRRRRELWISENENWRE